MSQIDYQALRQMTRPAGGKRRLDPRTGVLALTLLAAAACVAPQFMAAGLAQTPSSQQASPETAAFTLGFDDTLKFGADKSSEYVSTRRIKVLSVAAVQQLAQQSADYVEGKQRLDIVAAYTEKADGTKVAVDPATFITRDAATGLNGMFDLGHKIVTVIFPDVAVGDTVVLTTRTATRSDFSPWHLQRTISLSRNVPRADSTMQVIAPSSLPLKVGVRGESVQHAVVVEGAETRHVITTRGLPVLPAEERATSPLDRDPGIYISMFADYEDIGRTYWAAARGAIEVTPEIARLAGEITRGIDGRRAQAEAISAWVKTNIRYVLVDLGATAIVPHQAGAILKNRYGDCKDHVALMSALLSTKGIAVEHVLINLGTTFTLPEPAPVSVFNHVMLYLPEFGVYDDPTGQFSSFGVLSNSEYDKPVIHVSDGTAHLAHIPVMKPEDHVSIRRSRVSVAADGTVSGETEQIGTGWFAVNARSYSATMQAAGLERTAEERLRGAGTPGKGSFEIGSLTELSNSWSVRARFTLNDHMIVKPGANAAIPTGLGIQVRPGEYMLGPVLPARKQPFTCFAATQVEETDVTFADGLPLPQKIGGRTIENKYFIYTADYQLDGRTLKVRRKLVSRVPGQVCAPEVAAEIAQPLRDVFASNGTRMVFAAQSAPSPAASDHLEIKLNAGQPQQVDFLTALNPDCSPVGVAGVRVIEPPRHGKVTIDKGTGFTSYAQDNPRHACNRQRAEGMQVHYQPEAEYLGADSVTVDVVYGDGSFRKRHYAITMNPKPAPSELTRAAIAGQQIRIGFMYNLEPDCSSNSVASVRIIEQPQHGEAILKEDTGFTSFAKDNPRFECNSKRSDGLAVLYRSQDGFAGQDSVTVEIGYADGRQRSWRYSIEVR
jgi:transglutaminase-like putative cysteine protease